MHEVFESFMDLKAKEQAALADAIALAEQVIQRGNGPKYSRIVESMPSIANCRAGCDQSVVSVSSDSVTQEQQMEVAEGLQQLHPWRKGPFRLFDIHVDAEWRSDWKWDRVAPHLPSLAGKRIFDIGCGNGYYLFRMAADRPARIVGIDPYTLYYYQFLALQKYLCADNVSFLSLSLDDFPLLRDRFDIVICMGVLYHQRSPFDFLRRLREYLAEGGTLVLETLTVDGEGDWVLSPRERYAKMHNCFLLPTAECLTHWLQRCGFSNVAVVDQTVTTSDEQRRTDWMTFESLADFLDPADPTHTIEGYPAPQRSVVIARA